MDKEKIIEKIKKSLCTAAILYIMLKLPGTIQSITNFNAMHQYKEVIDDFSNFLSENGLSNPKVIFDCFNYALWNGNLSDNHELNYSLNRKIFLKNHGVGCIRGESVCLNNASMLADIFKHLGYKAYVITCYVEDFSITPIGSNEEIKRNVKEEANTKLQETLLNITKPFQYIFGNHAITCVEYENEFYYYDPTNLIYLGKSNVYNLNIINGTGKYSIRYLSSSLFNGILSFETISQTNDKLYKDEILNSKSTIIPKERLEIFFDNEKEIYKEIVNSSNGFIRGHIVTLIISNVMIKAGFEVFYKVTEKSFVKKKKIF